MKLAKRLISLCVALLMVFSSLSLIAVAATAYNIKTTTKYYREIDGEWKETTKFARGDTVRARVFIEADYYVGASEAIWFYPKDFMELNTDNHPKINESVYAIMLNTKDGTYVTDHELDGIVNYGLEGTEGPAATITDDGGGQYDPYLPLDEYNANNWGWVYIQIKSGLTAFKPTYSDWLCEFEFTITDDAEGTANMFIHEASLRSPDLSETVTAFNVQPKGEGASFNQGLKNARNVAIGWTLEYPESGDISLQNKVTFSAGANGSISGTTSYENAYIGDSVTAIKNFAAPTVSANAGYEFAGWTDGTTTSENLADFTVGYDGIALTALFKESVAPTADYTINVYTMGTDGEYNDPAVPATGTKNVGDTVAYDTTAIGEGFKLDEEKTTSTSMTIDADSANNVLDIYIARESYAIKFGDNEAENLYFGAEYAAPAAPAVSAGYSFGGWKAGDKVLQPGDKETVGTAAVTYTAVETPIDYNVTYSYVGAPEGQNHPAAETANINEVITLPTAPNGYSITWAVEGTGAVYNETANTVTVGAGDVAITGTWAANEYSLTYYLTAEDLAADKAFKTETYSYGAAVTAYAPTAEEVMGYQFVGWELEGDAELTDIPTTMPARNLKAVATMNEYTAVFYDEWGDAALTLYGRDVKKVTEADAPAIESTEFDFNGWKLGEDGEIEEETFSYDLTDNLEFYPDCTVDVIYYTDWDADAWQPAGEEHKKFTYKFGHVFTETDEVVVANFAAPEKDGYNFDSWNSEFYAEDEIYAHTVVGPNWTLGKYTATFNAVNGNLAGAFKGGETVKTVEDVEYNTVITFTEVPELVGYTFQGWTDVEGGTVALDDDKVVMNAEGKTFYAVYTENGKVGYAVEIYLMGTDGKYKDEPSSIDTTDKVATIGTIVTADHSQYPQASYFSPDETDINVKSATVTESGATLELYFKRATTQITINGETGDYYIGQEIPAPDVEIPDGYEQDETNPWIDENKNPVEVPYTVKEDGNPTEIKPNIVPKTDTAYTVEIYTMDVNGDYGAAEIVPDTTGTTGQEVTYTAAPETGFYLDEEKSTEDLKTTITADETDVIKVYYARNKYTVTIDGVAQAEKVYHEATIKAPTTSTTTEAGYTLKEWTGSDGKTYAIGADVPVTGDITLTAVNTANTNTAYTVEIYTMDVNGGYGAAEIVPDTTGTTGQEVTYTAAPETGFYLDEEKSTEGLKTTVTADDTDVIKVYYARYKYDVTVGGAKVAEVYYGGTYNAPAAPTVGEGQTFQGWDAGNGNVYDAGAAIEVTGALTLTAKIATNEYDVVFKVGDRVFSSGKAPYGTPITDPGVPGEGWIAEGYSFGGWSIDGVNKVTDFGTVGASGNNFVAILTPKTYTLEFQDDNGNTLSGPTDTAFGSDITAPKLDEQDGMTFVGWFDKDTNERMPATMPAKNTVYVAKWTADTDTPYKITVYVMDVDGTYVSTTTELFGTTGTEVSIIPDYSRTGFTVDTANSNIKDTIAANGTTELTVYYARNLYTVTFGDNAPVEVLYGAAIPVPADPTSTEEGKVFDKWTPEVPKVMPAENLVFEATWAPAVYTITYVINGKTEAPISYTYGEKVATPATPDETGLKFKGWNPKVPETMPAENLIIVAEFEAAVYKVTFYDDVVDGEVFDVKYVEYGDTITLPATNPTKEYHTFEGWLNVPETMREEDISIYPDFKRVDVVLVPKDENSTAKIDRTNKVITGLEERIKEADYFNKFLAVEGDGHFTVEPANGKTGFYGTGAVVKLYDNVTGELLETYHVVIYGDVNGDSSVNAADVSAVDDEIFWVTTWSKAGSADYAYYKVIAADLDKDGDVDGNDLTSIKNYTVGVVSIDQTTGNVER